MNEKVDKGNNVHQIISIQITKTIRLELLQLLKNLIEL